MSYAAKWMAARCAKRIGLETVARKLAAEADRPPKLRSRVLCPDIETYALALDGAKKPCQVRTSNAGQVLFTGIAAFAPGARVAKGIAAAELFLRLGGIPHRWRRRSALHPMSYHNGSVGRTDNCADRLRSCALRTQAGDRDFVRGAVQRRHLYGPTPAAGIVSAFFSSNTGSTARRSIRSLRATGLGQRYAGSRCLKPRSVLSSIPFKGEIRLRNPRCPNFWTR